METKLIALTRQEAEIMLDSFKVTSSLTRGLALKAAGVVLEFASEEPIGDFLALLDASPSAPVPTDFPDEA